MVAYTKLQQRKKEESKSLRGERDQMNFTDLRFERWQVVTRHGLLSSDTLVQYLSRYKIVLLRQAWCRGVVVTHADSQHRGCQFDSPMCHF